MWIRSGGPISLNEGRAAVLAPITLPNTDSLADGTMTTGLPYAELLSFLFFLDGDTEMAGMVLFVDCELSRLSLTFKDDIFGGIGCEKGDVAGGVLEPSEEQFNIQNNHKYAMSFLSKNLQFIRLFLRFGTLRSFSVFFKLKVPDFREFN